MNKKKRFRRRPPPRAMVSIFSTLGVGMVVKIFLACLGLMSLGMTVWILAFDAPGPLPSDHFRTRDVVLMFLAWVGIMALTEVGWQVALHEVRAWGRRPIQLLWNAGLVAFNVLTILLVVDVFGLKLSGHNWADMGLRSMSLGWLLGSVGLGALGMVLGGAVAALVIRLQGGDWKNPQEGFLAPTEQSTQPSEAEPVAEEAPADPQEKAVRARLSLLGAVAMVLLVGMMVPFVEELLFRGVLYAWLSERTVIWLAVPVSALAFGVAHWQAGRPVVAATAVIGIFLALAYHFSHSLWAPVIMHGVNNLAKVTLTYIVRD